MLYTPVYQSHLQKPQNLSSQPEKSPNLTTSFASTPYSILFHCALTVYHQNLKSLVSSTLSSSLPSLHSSSLTESWSSMRILILFQCSLLVAIFISHIPHVMELGDEIGVLILFHCPFSTTLSPSSLQNTRPYEIHPFLVMYKPSPSFIEDMSIQVIFFILGDFSIHVGDHTQHL